MVRSVNKSAPLAIASSLEVMLTNRNVDSIGAGEGDSTHGDGDGRI